jgi:endonuclease/exonuclease/phosphatase family metal-dependent hydrolase
MGGSGIRRGRALVCALTFLVLASCTGTGPGGGSQPQAKVELEVLSFNMLYGGSYGYQRVLRVIRELDPDIVGVQEPYGKIDRIAEDLGWHGSPRLHVISRFPVLEPSGSSGDWGYVEVTPGRVVAIANTHLPSVGYGPYLVRSGAPVGEVLEAERKRRVPWTMDLLNAMAPVLSAGNMPVFLTGDFNSPSHRDWTAEVDAVRGPVRYPVRWPVTVALEEAGFQDSYREVHPDPVEDPAFTWTPGSGFPPRIREGEVLDRIDYVWANGPVEVVDSQVVGEAGSPYAGIEFDPWPSDHRAVLTTVEATPAAPGTTVAVSDARLERGDSLEASFFGAGDSARRVRLLADDSVLAERSTEGAASGSVRFETQGLGPGTYDAALLGDSGKPLAAVSFAVVDPDAPVRIETQRSRVEVGEAIDLSWRNGPGNRYDWLAVTPAGKGPGSYMAWRYIDAAVHGDGSISAASNGRWPLPPGSYQIHLCVDDSYRCEAVTRPFEIVAR